MSSSVFKARKSFLHPDVGKFCKNLQKLATKKPVETGCYELNPNGSLQQVFRNLSNTTRLFACTNSNLKLNTDTGITVVI